jgi:hypothetical protein
MQLDGSVTLIAGGVPARGPSGWAPLVTNY